MRRPRGRGARARRRAGPRARDRRRPRAHCDLRRSRRRRNARRDCRSPNSGSRMRPATPVQPGAGEGRHRGMEPIDAVAFAILLLAALRGMSLGLIREVSSLAALAAAVIAVRVWDEPFAHWLQRASGHQLPHYLVPWVAGTLLAVAVVAAVGTFGRVMRQGARAVGLGFFDRLGGAAVGIAEGAIAAGVV